ncbi:MAG: Sec-independent protein translocase subunit TatB [Nocardia sp.]|nr:Sec-independent protein translocase subunit TatB [Nocardia sp.]
MFGGIGWPELFIILVAALVILGPERLPGAVQWVMGAARRCRDYINGAADELRTEFGSELDQFREPLDHIRQLRTMTPRAAATKYLFDGDDSILTGEIVTGEFTEVRRLVRGGEVPDPANCGVVVARDWFPAGEVPDPANCGVVRPGEWTGAADGSAPATPRMTPMDPEAT